MKKYEGNKNIRFLGGIYDLDKLNNLRYYSDLYFHGHSVGGTNPSLLEAMASNTCIVAHNNVFNKTILKEDAFYFDNASEIKDLIEKEISIEVKNQIKINNIARIKQEFTWDKIVKSYEDLFANLAS